MGVLVYLKDLSINVNKFLIKDIQNPQSKTEGFLLFEIWTGSLVASNTLLTCSKWDRNPPGPQKEIKRCVPSHTDNVDIRNGFANVGSSPTVPTKCLSSRGRLLSD